MKKLYYLKSYYKIDGKISNQKLEKDHAVQFLKMTEGSLFNFL